MLGWRESQRVVALELRAEHRMVRRWIQAWRQRLLLLDPSGAMEAWVRLGLLAQPSRIQPPAGDALRASRKRRESND
ncbi:hypothetical protein CFB89_13830 [Burkholderia sp. AU16741]|uniref:DUF746 domain-containing protein n=1 Tax=Burkholderia sp. AU16741 TaxID=2015347 RepID=UPI000B7A0FDB|nr:hypothetical protein CFB89_13830 [Burkholderia sp. AU16741]